MNLKIKEYNKNKNKYISLRIVGVILLILTVTALFQSTSSNYFFSAENKTENKTENNENLFLESKLKPKKSNNYLNINGNSQMNSFFAGNGTDGSKLSPYVLKDKNFSYCKIENTNLYLSIENCSFFGYFYFLNSSNIIMENNVFFQSFQIKFENCSEIIIKNNEFIETRDMNIYLLGNSTNFLIYSNNFHNYYNPDEESRWFSGIHSIFTTTTTLTNITISSNSFKNLVNGIMDLSSVFIYNNTFFNCNNGISFCNNCNISNNIFETNNIGISAWNNNTISNNIFNNNSNLAMKIDYNNTVTDNTIISKFPWLEECGTGNYFNNNEFIILLDSPVLITENKTITTKNTILEWEEVAFADCYNIYVNGTLNATAPENSFELFLNSNGTYKITITTINDTSESEPSDPIIINVELAYNPSEQGLTPPTITTINQTISEPDKYIFFEWTSVSGATSYNIYVNGTLVATTTSTQIELDDYPIFNGIYLITVTATNSTYESGFSNTLKITVNFTEALGDIPGYQWTFLSIFAVFGIIFLLSRQKHN